jgi:drug/metabolite transporter (DMT)-like permease
MLAAAAAFSMMAVCMKVIGRTLPVWEMLVLRALFALTVLAPAIVRAGPKVLATTRPGAHLLRNVIGMSAVVSFYYALAHLELALVTTLSFTRTLFVILLAVAFLGERVRWRRTVATLAGFAGVVVCVQPGSTAFDPWTLVALTGALGTAGVSTAIKRLTTTESPLTIVALSYVIMGSLAAIPAALDWHAPNVQEVALVAFMGLLSAAGQSCMVRGLRDGEATAVAPFDYSRLIYSAALGYLLFAEVPSAATWAGGAIIISSTLYIAVREARLRTTDGST